MALEAAAQHRGRRHDWVEAEDFWGSGELPLSRISSTRLLGLWECTFLFDRSAGPSRISSC